MRDASAVGGYGGALSGTPFFSRKVWILRVKTSAPFTRSGWRWHLRRFPPWGVVLRQGLVDVGAAAPGWLLCAQAVASGSDATMTLCGGVVALHRVGDNLELWVQRSCRLGRHVPEGVVYVEAAASDVVWRLCRGGGSESSATSRMFDLLFLSLSLSLWLQCG